jgi:hypothetical protein
MRDSPIHLSQFETPFGVVCTWLENSRGNSYISTDQVFNQYKAHKVTLMSAEFRNEWLPEGFSIESSIIWRWYIEKANELEENLTICCKLIDQKQNVYCGGSSGQYVQAFELQNDTHHAYIGTEDGELMQYRAEQNDWMPNRFKDVLSEEFSFIEDLDCGFKVNVPKLLMGEKIYFHFLVAVDKIRPHKTIPNEVDESTWLAVTFQKSILDDYLNV